MYDQLEALWRRMVVDEEAMCDFVAANRRTTPSVVHAYEEELERMIDLKHERMCEFIANVRTEIENLWEGLLENHARTPTSQLELLLSFTNHSFFFRWACSCSFSKPSASVAYQIKHAQR
ncbi:hypothetical protein F4604DRAFT_1763387, partial [Suillus subluteus]